MVWKQMTVKILVYTVKVRLCYSCCLAKMSQSRNKNDKPLYFIILIRQLIVTHVSKTLNVWILFCRTWMATENCYYQKLTKTNLIASKQVALFKTCQSYITAVFFMIIWHLFSWNVQVHFNYCNTTIIEISRCKFCLNNNFLTQLTYNLLNICWGE